eukprot:superscaffoldBa00001992_g12779
MPTPAVEPPPQDCVCGAKISAMDTHPVCVACLGVQHAQAALDSPGSCEHRSRFTHESLHCRLSRQASLSVQDQLLTSAGAPTDSATPGVRNWVVDLLSRGNPLYGEWRLHLEVTNRVRERYGCPTMDLFDLWAISFVFTRMSTLTLMFLAVGFGLARAENQGLDLEMGNFNTVLIRSIFQNNFTNPSALGPFRMTVLLLVCLTQSWLLWKFIRFQLRRWREFRHEQAVRKKAAAKQPLRPLKRDSLSSGGQWPV